MHIENKKRFHYHIISIKRKIVLKLFPVQNHKQHYNTERVY